MNALYFICYQDLFILTMDGYNIFGAVISFLPSRVTASQPQETHAPCGVGKALGIYFLNFWIFSQHTFGLHWESREW